MTLEEEQKKQDINSQNKQDSGSKIQIIIAIFTFIGVISGEIFTNWDKIFSKSSNTESSLGIPLQASVKGIGRDTCKLGHLVKFCKANE